jgi:hypothetical protein
MPTLTHMDDAPVTDLICGVCDNGQLVVMKQLPTGRLFVECRECLTGWWHPTDLSTSFRTETMDGNVTPATTQDVTDTGWEALLHR